VARVEERGITVLHHRALRGADLPGLPGQADPVPRWLEQRAARWNGVRAWFRPVDGARPRVAELADVARRAILSLMRALERLAEARRRGSSTAADFRTLARWFARCDSDDEAHELWAAAFGLWPARHTHLAADDPGASGATTSWWNSPAVPVSPLLRTHGQLDKVARTARVRDTSTIRESRRERAWRQRGEMEEAWARLATPGPVRLSAFATLDFAGFTRLLELLARALGSRSRRGVTADGRLVVTLADPPDGATATLHTPRGTFTGPDYVVSIRPAEVQQDRE
jgi:uncharacterized protein (TIGR02677 family)